MQNILGATITLAPGATDVAVPDFSTTQYNPVPWDTNLRIDADVQPTNAADAGAKASVTFFARGKEYFKNASVSDEGLSPVYSQLGKAMLRDGTPWNLTVSNPSNISVDVTFNLRFYHDDEQGNPAQRPTDFV